MATLESPDLPLRADTLVARVSTGRLGSELPELAPNAAARGAELFHTLAQSASVRVERIVSQGHASAPDFWYDQSEDEFVLLVSGAACLEFEGGSSVELGPNDWLNIPAHVRHRVAWTASDRLTLWLAVFSPSAAAKD